MPRSKKPSLIRRVLPNGLRFYAMPLPGTSAATTMVMYQVGSRYETDEIAGISHFLEHMMFKGTPKRPDAKYISRELDSLGAEYNAFTSKDLTGYYIKVAAEQLETALTVQADMLTHSTFSSAIIKRERHVIVEEMRMYEDNPLMYLEDIFEERIFGKTTLGRQIIGTRRSVLGTTRANILRYFTDHYHPRNMVVVVAGSLNPNQAFATVKRLFGKLKARPLVQYTECHYPQSAPQTALLTRKTEQAQVALGFPALPYVHPQLAALEVLHGILGSGMSSRLFETIREQQGLAYSIRTSISNYEDTGTFYVKGGLDPKKTLHAIDHILKECARITRQLVTLEELHRAKSYLSGQLALELEESDNYAGWIAKQALFMPRIESIEEVHQRIAAVSREDVRNIARKIFVASRLNLAVIGPFAKKAPFERVLKRFSQMR